jgi:uncharacterized protein (TIGR03437 family)
MLPAPQRKAAPATSPGSRGGRGLLWRSRIKRQLVTCFTIAASLAAFTPVASAYYYFVYFAGPNGPFTAIPAKFDLSVTPDSHSVSYFISDQGPSAMMPGDSFQSLVSEIRLAASTWNGVSSSNLKLAFGGLYSANTQQASPGIDVIFDPDIVPGLLAYTTITTNASTNPVTSTTPFVPIQNSTMHLWKDLTVDQQASYNDSFFLTIVHEFGHTQGLQHSLTSGVMSTSVTRGTTKAQPLAADDIAGISLLYPVQGYAASTGSISGSVLLTGAGVNMASVVALSTSGVAISSLSNPDGTYSINGIPPGQYYVYAQPLPPPALGEAYPDNVVPPQGPSQTLFPANIGFDTEFFPGTRDWTQAATVSVGAGSLATGVNFNMQTRSNGPTVYDGEVYAYQGVGGQVPVQSPSLQSGTRTAVAMFAFGTVVNTNQLAPGLNVTVVGGPAQVEAGTLAYFTGGYLQMVLDTGSVTASVPAALAITVSNDMYVLPAAFAVVPAPPPSIASVTPGFDGQGNPTASIAGSNLNSGTRILFDGAQASLLSVNTGGSLLVSVPPGSGGGSQAAVEALSNDGQTSLQAIGPSLPPTFVYSGSGSPAISLNPATAIAGTDMFVEISGFSTNFGGLTAVGFGSSDILVRQMWVLDQGHLLVDISVAQGAPSTLTSVSVATGDQLATLTTAFQILATNPGQISLRTPVVNQATGLAGVPAGGVALINTGGLPQNLSGWALLIGGQPAGFSVGAGGQIAALVPSGLLTGPVLVQLTSPNGASIPPVIMQLDPPPPVIASASPSGASTASASSLKSGTSVTLTVYGLAVNNAYPLPANVQIGVGGAVAVALSVTPIASQAGACQVQFALPANLPDGPIPVTITTGTRVSSPFLLTIEN